MVSGPLKQAQPLYERQNTLSKGRPTPEEPQKYNKKDFADKYENKQI